MSEQTQNEDFGFSVPEQQLHRSVPGHSIYLLVLVLTIGILGALPLVKVPVTVTGQGMIRPDNNRSMLSAPGSGRIVKCRMSESRKVRAGDTLLVLDETFVSAQVSYIRERARQLQQLIRDLEQLCRLKDLEDSLGDYLDLQSAELRFSYLNFRNSLKGKQIRMEQLLSAFQRYSALYELKAVSFAEFELREKEYQTAAAEIQSLISTQQSVWRDRISEYQKESRGLGQSILQLNEQARQFYLIAPITGTLQNVKSLAPGSIVFTNEPLAEISPDSNLLAFCWLDSKDIGLINPGHNASLQIDAFNSRDWGSISARVVEIGADMMPGPDGNPRFLVKCKLGSDFLALPSGYRGYIRKGMGINARFRITSRTLFQLLFDRVQNWVGPEIADGKQIYVVSNR